MVNGIDHSIGIGTCVKPQGSKPLALVCMYPSQNTRLAKAKWMGLTYSYIASSQTTEVISNQDSWLATISSYSVARLNHSQTSRY